MIDLTDAAADPLVGALSLAEAETRLAEGLRDLPELARVLENPITAGAALGASDGTSPGVWYLELDHEDEVGMSDRPSFGGLDVWNGGGNGSARARAAVGPRRGRPAVGGARRRSTSTRSPWSTTSATSTGWRACPSCPTRRSRSSGAWAACTAQTVPARRPAGAAPRGSTARPDGGPGGGPGGPAPGGPGVPGGRPDVALGEAAAGNATGATLSQFLAGVGDGTLTLADRICWWTRRW